MRDVQLKLLLFAVAPAAILLSIPFSIPDSLVKKFPEQALASIADRVTAETVLVSDRVYVQAACWTLKRTDVRLLGSRSELEYGLDQAESNRHYRYAELDDFLRDPERDVEVVCILDDSNHGDRLIHPKQSWMVEFPGLLVLGFEPVSQ